MALKALLFDVNGTMIDIKTDESLPEIYQVISRYLTYFAISISPQSLEEIYFQLLDEQLKGSPEKYPEADVVAIWQQILEKDQPAAAINTSAQGDMQNLPLFLARLHRTLSHRRLQLYPQVTEVLNLLRSQYRLGVVSDAQSAYARGELASVQLLDYFEIVIISGDYGYRKPDPRLFSTALNQLGIKPKEAVYIGNDMYHDMFGAKQVGLRTIFYSTQYGKKEQPGIEPDYIIYNFGELTKAIEFLSN